jgi:hypothetical protein
MLTKKVNIGFVIWGVRNGFEVMLASNLSEVEFLKSDVVSDNMRQVCNTTSEIFYSIHRNQKFGVVTIYHSDAKDMVGRKAYVAISLYIPANYQFIGDVVAALNHLKNFYIQKQANSYVNMFTAQMFTEQYSTLDCEINNGFVIPGISKGYLKFNNLNEIKERFRLLDINGYQAAFFIPISASGPETQLQGYQIINEFKDTIGVLVEGYDSSKHKIIYNNEPVSKLETNFLLEVKPGIEIIFIDLINNRKQSFLRFTPNQVINLVALFPVVINKSYDFGSKDPLSFTSTQPTIKKKENKVGKILLVCGAFISIIALVVVATLGDEIVWPWNESKVAAPTGGAENVGDNGGEGNNGGVELPVNTIIQKEISYTIKDLYKKNILNPKDTNLIKEGVSKIDGIISVSFSSDLKQVRLKYDSLKIKNAFSILKNVQLKSGNGGGTGRGTGTGGGSGTSSVNTEKL